MSFRTFLKAATAGAAAALLPTVAVADCGCENPAVMIDQGVVSGFMQNNTHVFLGIPFAESTGGENRWRAPVPVAASKNLINATQYGPTCAQAMSGDAIVAQGEDCLNLNIWKPMNGSDLPVFVYIYGGAMVTGGNSNAQWQGYNFARKDVVYVNVNYRESIFGAPNAPELEGQVQNFDILDVELAVQWVYDNIEAFGGDRNRIVLGGHSSGSVMVDHYLWNNPDTFLAGAIEMSANAKSGPAITPSGVGLTQVAQDIEAAGVTLNCSSSNPTLDCLREVDLYSIQTSNFNSTTNTWFTPIVDNITRFADYRSQFLGGQYASHVPLIVGNSDQEGALFGIVYGSENTNFTSWIHTYDADLAFVPDEVLLNAYNASDYASVSAMSGASYGDARFLCATDYMLNLRASEQPTWIYRWFGNYSNVLGIAGIGASHGSEVPFFHGGNECFSKLSNVTTPEQELADYMNDWLVAWIADPAAGPGWDQATPLDGPVAKLGVPGDELSMQIGRTGQFNERCRSAYEPYYPSYPVVQNPVE